MCWSLCGEGDDVEVGDRILGGVDHHEPGSQAASTSHRTSYRGSSVEKPNSRTFHIVRPNVTVMPAKMNGNSSGDESTAC